MKNALLGFLVLVLWPLGGSAQTSAEDYYREGLTYYQAGKWKEAISYLEGAVRQNPKFWKAYQITAYCYYRMKETEQSIQNCEASLRIHADNPVLQAFLDKLRSQSLHAQNFAPIETRRGGTDIHPTEDYYWQGAKVETFEELKMVIVPLHDPEAIHLLNESADKESAGFVLMGGGAALCLGGALYMILATGSTTTEAGPLGEVYTLTSPPDLTLGWILGGVGVVAGTLGIFFEMDSGQDRHDAIQRYNRLVEPDQNLSMILIPRTELPGLAYIRRF